MHPRADTWLSLTPLDSFDAAWSDDGWIRLRIALETDIHDRRSWALDPEAAEHRTWSPIDLPHAEAVDGRVATRVYSPSEGVEGGSNPHEDTRGVVEETYSGATWAFPLPGGPTAAGGHPSIDVTISRSRDGIRVDLPLQPGSPVYGLGERTGGLDKRGRTWTFWNSDEPLHTPDRDPLYQSIPVAYLFAPDATTTFFSDSPATQYFDVGEANRDTLRVEVYDSQVELYLRIDASLPEAVSAYTGLTGRMPLPPEWALGFQQCRYSYFPEARVYEIAERIRKERIPCDVIYLDIHYMAGYRVFTWDPVRFPDPARMMLALRERGFHVVTIVDPGVKVDPNYSVYLDGVSRGAFVGRNEATPYVGRVWPGDAVFPDFTDSAGREFWAEQHSALLGPGVDGIWNDMNEPADFTGDSEYRPNFTVPDDLIARNDGAPVGFGRVHNAFANGMNQATRQGLSASRPDERGFVLTRAGYAGIQRSAAVWTGDNHSWWEHISLMTPMSLNLGLSGVAFNGPDTGGFQANASGEMFARWVAASCLMPFFRSHTALDTLDHEAWTFEPEALAAARSFIELRYQLLPYLYTLFEEASRTGAPIMRPLIWEFPDDGRFVDRADSFLVGPHLLVAPIRERGVAERAVAIPAGAWHDFWTGEVVLGPTTIAVEAPLTRLPLFVRAGAVIPYEAVRQHTGESGDGILRLLVASDPGAGDAPGAAGSLYADAGDGFAFRDGTFWRADIRLSGHTLSIRTIEGDPAEARWDRVSAARVGSGLPVPATGDQRLANEVTLRVDASN